MRILNRTTGEVFNEIELLLTPDEASELRDMLDNLVRDPSGHHSHVADAEYVREITVAIYLPENLSQFDELAQKVIAAD